MADHEQQPEKFWYTEKELAERFGVAQTTLRRWVKTNKFPQPTFINSVRRWPASDVQRFETTAQAGVSR